MYFLQKKGWFGVKKDEAWGTGSKHFLRELFDGKHTSYKNFFNDILEPLFYEALRLDRNHDDAYYSPFQCKIPFLNGGLFDPLGNYDWVKVDIHLPNTLFSNQEETQEGDIGNGILDIFDRYNFTVQEDEALDKEVAIDPELLGKTYEKLNAIRSDNFQEFQKSLKTQEEAKFNKTYGVYYTPREIVHFMCKISLIHYLEKVTKIKKEDIEMFVEKSQALENNEETSLATEEKIRKGEQKGSSYKSELPESIRKNAHELDQKLADIVICDPAIGSGAFPVEMMNTIVKLRSVLAIFLHNKKEIYNFKKHCIEHSLYGVDIDSGAIEIARLRLWLSLVVEESHINNIKTLPNLDYKIVQGDTLPFIEKSNLFNDVDMKKLANRQKTYITETKPSEKLKLKKEIESIRAELYIFNGIKFDFKIEFSQIFNEKQGFDIVIGNPPYIQLQKNGSKLAKRYQKYNYKSFTSAGDIYCLFYERGHQLLNENGKLCYVTSNKWMRAGYGEELRNYFASQCHPQALIDLGSSIFETATVDTNILLLGKEKTAKNNLQGLDLGRIQKEDSQQLSSTFKKHAIQMPQLSKEIWTILSPLEQNLQKKIEKIGTPLKDWNIQINYGIKTGYNEAFIIDGATKDKLIQKDPKSAKIIKPILRGKDVKRYYTDFADKWLIFIPWHFPLERDKTITGASRKAEKEFKIKYPFVYKHLLKYKEPLSKRNKAETGISYEWYALQRCASTYYPEFEKDKIVYSEIVQEAQFYYDSQKYYPEATIFIMTGNVNLKYITAFCNSKLIDYAFKRFYAGGGLGEKGYRYKKKFFENLPIPKLTKKQESTFEKLVEPIQKAKLAKKDTRELEAKIDKLVYELYELTPKEIKFIEEESK